MQINASLILLCAGLALPRPAMPAPAPEDVHDVAVVGGGLAGLTAAHFLKDQDIVVLEKEDRAGGKARAERWGRLGYSSAATYFSEPYGAIKRLLKDLGLKAKAIPHPQDSVSVGGRTVADFLGIGIDSLPHPEEEKAQMRRMAADMRRYAQGPLVAMPPVPSGPALTEEMRARDTESFRDFLLRSYGSLAASYADLICRGIFGAGAADISALQGINALGAQYGPTAAFEGGLGAVSEALTAELGSRLRTRSAVLSVAQDSEGVRITYVHEGRTQTLRAKAAVIAVGAPVILKIIPELAASRRTELESVRYSAYALLVLAVKEPLPMKSMSLWSPGLAFTDLSLPGIASPAPAGGEGPKQLILAAVPFGAGGQASLAGTSDAELVRRVVLDAEKLFPGISGKLLGARVVRWPYAMPVVGPGYLTRLRPRLAEPEGRIFFAGQETEMPYSEGAIVSGFRAASEIRGWLKKSVHRGVP